MAKKMNPADKWPNGPTNAGSACNPPHPGMPGTMPKPSPVMPPKSGGKKMGGKGGKMFGGK